MTAKTLFTGKTHSVGGANGSARSADGFLDIQLPEAHPAAENLFGAAWSACFMGALAYIASQKKIALPEAPTVDATIDLLADNSGFFLKAKLDVAVPGLDRAVAQDLVDSAHAFCPYSKAVRGNIDVEVTLVEAAFA